MAEALSLLISRIMNNTSFIQHVPSIPIIAEFYKKLKTFALKNAAIQPVSSDSRLPGRTDGAKDAAVRKESEEDFRR